MDVEASLTEYFANHIEVASTTALELTGPLDQAGLAMANCLLSDRKIVACGDGQAALLADLLCGYLVTGFSTERPELPCIALSTQAQYRGSTDYAEVFSRQIKALGQSGDMLLAFTNGKPSELTFRAVLAARDKDMTTLLLDYPAGSDSNTLLGDRDIRLVVPTAARHHLIEMQVCLIHCLTTLVDYYIFGENSQHET
jgi:D-sedoheptulose 7-phosphate isomerase